MSQACLDCGACCAAFRVSFYWAETDAHPAGTVPHRLTTAVTPFLAAMRGSESAPPRCVALEGEVGQSVRCAIYAQRSTTCRDFEAGSERCHAARQKHGLAQLASSADQTAPPRFSAARQTARPAAAPD